MATKKKSNSPLWWQRAIVQAGHQVADLASMTDEQVLTIRGVGRKGLRKIRAAVGGPPISVEPECGVRPDSVDTVKWPDLIPLPEDVRRSKGDRVLVFANVLSGSCVSLEILENTESGQVGRSLLSGLQNIQSRLGNRVFERLIRRACDIASSEAVGA